MEKLSYTDKSYLGDYEPNTPVVNPTCKCDAKITARRPTKKMPSVYILRFIVTGKHTNSYEEDNMRISRPPGFRAPTPGRSTFRKVGHRLSDESEDYDILMNRLYGKYNAKKDEFGGYSGRGNVKVWRYSQG